MRQSHGLSNGLIITVLAVVAWRTLLLSLPSAAAFGPLALVSTTSSSSSSSVGGLSRSVFSIPQQHQQQPLHNKIATTSRHKADRLSPLWMNARNHDSDDVSNDDEEDGNSSSNTLVDTAGLVAQPVVWMSLYNVATTGAGLPAGPFGIVGGVEGLSYLLLVGLAGSSLFSPSSASSSGRQRTAAQQLSLVTLAAGLLTLLTLVGDQGCVPNANPLLDYSAYLPVCHPDQTPGLFGG